MSKFLTRGAPLLILAGFAAPAFAADTVTANGSATIIQAMSISESSTLRFGTVSKPSSGSGTVTINATTGARSVTGGVTAVTDGSTPSGRGVLAVTGDGSRAFTATVPANFTLSNGTPADDITVTLTSNVPAALSSGSATVGIGGSFTLASTQTAGAFTGTFNVSVAYN